MALENIEYGSIASSETMNKNFSYLDNKIAETHESIMTSISSILSNIATINSRLSDLSEGIDNTSENLENKLEDYKLKTKKLVKKATMLPKWTDCSAINFQVNTVYNVPSNGYLLLHPDHSATGNLMINNFAVGFKVGHGWGSLVAIPVCEGDVVTCSVGMNYVYFLPAVEVNVEDF